MMEKTKKTLSLKQKNRDITLLLFFLSSFFSLLQAQIDGNLLLNLTNATTTEMNATTNPITGSLLYNTTENWVYQYNGILWEKLKSDNLPLVSEKTSNYTITEADNGTVFTFNSATDVTITISSGLPVGFNISVYQIGEGNVIFTEGTGVNIKNRLSRYKTAGKDAGAGIICTASNIFHLSGDLKR